MAKSTAPVCHVDGGRLLDWSGDNGADYICPAVHGALGKPLWFQTVWEGKGHGSTYSIEPLPGQDDRPYMTPREAREAGRTHE
jgi:hypothetical protein